MPDPFALLGLPRRPWLADEVIRAAFQERARQCHPDAAGGDGDDFAALNAAHTALADPAVRLQLLAGTAVANGMPADGEFGFRVGAVLRAADGVIMRLSGAKNALERALLAPEIATARESLKALDLAARFARAEKKLRALDAAWPEVAAEDLAALGAEFRFLQRWRAQVRERQLELSI